MSRYTEAVEYNLEGLSAVSTGLCPGCDECREAFDEYVPTDNEPVWADTLPWKDGEWHVPISPGVSFPSESEALEAAREAFDEAWGSGTVYSEPSFSWSGCEICGTSLGGDFDVWHAIDENGDLFHGDRACVDCQIFLANGDEPESWRDGPEDTGEED